MKKTRKLFIALLTMATLVLAVCGFAACNNTPNNGDKVLATVITLDQSEATLKVGETLQLNAVVDFKATDKSVEWTSSDASKATVSNEGLVTAVAAGNTTITVKTKDGSNLSKTCTVTVKEAAAVKCVVDQLLDSTFAPEEPAAAGAITFYDDGTFLADLFLNGALNAPVVLESTWEVVDGAFKFPTEKTTITILGYEGKAWAEAVVVGNTVEIIIAIDNEEAVGRATKCILTAEQAALFGVTVGTDIAVTGITLSETTHSMVSGTNFDPATLATVEPADATNKTITVELKDDSTEIVRISDNKIYAVKAGTTDVVLKAGSRSATLSVTVTYPEKSGYFTSPVAFEEDAVFTGIFVIVPDVMELPISFAFDTEGMVYFSGVGSSMGYYNVTKTGDAISEVEVKLFENAAEYTFTYAETDDAVTLTDKNTGEGTLGTLTKEAAKFFEKNVTFATTPIDTGSGLIYQEITFKTDGTYTFEWYFMTEDPILVEHGTYTLTNDTLTTVVTNTAVDLMNMAGTSAFTATLTTNADGLRQFVLGDGTLIEIKPESITMNAKFYYVLDMSALGLGKSESELQLKENGTYTFTMKMSDTVVLQETGTYEMTEDTLTLTAQTTESASGLTAAGEHSITYVDGVMHIKVGETDLAKVEENA